MPRNPRDEYDDENDDDYEPDPIDYTDDGDPIYGYDDDGEPLTDLDDWYDFEAGEYDPELAEWESEFPELDGLDDIFEYDDNDMYGG